MPVRCERGPARSAAAPAQGAPRASGGSSRRAGVAYQHGVQPFAQQLLGEHRVARLYARNRTAARSPRPQTRPPLSRAWAGRAPPLALEPARASRRASPARALPRRGAARPDRGTRRRAAPRSPRPARGLEQRDARAGSKSRDARSGRAAPRRGSARAGDGRRDALAELERERGLAPAAQALLKERAVRGRGDRADVRFRATSRRDAVLAEQLLANGCTPCCTRRQRRRDDPPLARRGAPWPLCCCRACPDRASQRRASPERRPARGRPAPRGCARCSRARGADAGGGRRARLTTGNGACF